MIDVGGVRRCLARMSDTIRPWRDVEAEIADHLSTDVFLGGDGLRPYALWQQADHIHLCHTPRADLGNPPLVDDTLSGEFGLAIHDDQLQGVAHLVLPASAGLAQRLDLPTALIVGLGDAERYRGARLALGIARLGQWLRFTHAARTHVLDYNLLDRPLDTVEHFLAVESPDLVGLGVNFGQWHQLAEIADIVNSHPVQAVVLGNILAAYDPDRVAERFKAREDNRVMVATTLGERPLQTLCSRIDAPETWDDIPGLVRPRPDTARQLSVSSAPVEPPPLVFPDDGLVAAVAERAGQVAVETSFGCNFGACTFCPRDHRGDGWSRGQVATVDAILSRLAGSGAVVSLVDEEFFGTEGLADPPRDELPAQRIMHTCRRHGIHYEIYTRLEQIVDRRRSRDWNLRRATLLTSETATMRRIFVGVESGAERQLRRYGKGQTVAQTVDALRVGSALGVPMEFGFITFDPLLTADELAENVAFLARRDVIKQTVAGGIDERASTVSAYLDGTDVFGNADVALYQRVAYMATELEVLAHSRYAAMLRRRHPDLLTGHYDPSFARYETLYADSRIGAVAGWCRVWTEGMFTAVYEARMQARSTSDSRVAARAHTLIERYRDATFALVLAATRTLLPETRPQLAHLAQHSGLDDQPSQRWLHSLAADVLGSDTPLSFDLALMDARRTT